MNNLVNILIKDRSLPSLFTFVDFEKRGYDKILFEKELLEGLEKKYIDRVYGDIYTLDSKYRNTVIPKCVLSQMIDPDSYVSMQYVLSDYNWIPEMIFSVTSVTHGQDKMVDTSRYGSFIYIPLYKDINPAGIYIEEDFEGTYKVAKPLRALCDLLYFKNKNWPWCIDNLYEVLRISEYSLKEDLTSKDFDELQGVYKDCKIERFLEISRVELKL
ncbi:hypothetical protein R84B8_00623 [Treponema sp. R8-4-B8]